MATLIPVYLTPGKPGFNDMKNQNFNVIMIIVFGASLLVACTPSPAWVQSQDEKIRVTLLAPEDKDFKPGETSDMTVILAVTDKPLSFGSDTPIHHSGNNKQLGARLLIHKPNLNHEQLSIHVHRCIDKAAEQGVIRSFSSTPSGQNRVQTVYASKSIEAFLNRFNDCLDMLGYSSQIDDKDSGHSDVSSQIMQMEFSTKWISNIPRTP